MRTHWITVSLLVLMTLALALSAMAANQAVFALIIAVLGMIWLILLFLRRHFANDALFILFMGFSVFGVFQKFSLPILLAVVCFDLAVWNLANFARQMKAVDKVVNQRQLENIRLRRLGFTLVGGYLLGLVPIFVQIDVPFFVLLLLTLLAAYLLGHGLMGLRKKDEPDFKDQ